MTRPETTHDEAVDTTALIKSTGITSTEITRVLDHHTSVLEQLTSGASLTDVLDSVVGALEGLMTDSRCSILLLDDEGRLRHGSAPSLPAAYSDAIDGLVPGPEAGSCGTAVFLDSQVVAVDVLTDPRWVSFRDLATEHDLRACWSSPIRRGSEVVGTFAVYHPNPYTPDAHDAELVRRFTHLASLAIEYDLASAATLARHDAELARQGAERANHARSQFVTALSHELRAPLQAITGFTESLLTLDLDPERRREALERISRGAEHILSIVDDVLDLARVEAGAMPIEFTDVDVAAEVVAGVEMIQPLAQRRNVSVDVAIDTAHTTNVSADRRRLRQVVINLVANAVRFSSAEATVRVIVDTAHELGNENCVRVHVVDNGPGIPAELLARLFVPFDRLGADSGREGGAGLGLVLARRLTEAMNGTLDVDSVVGVGTHATVSLPTLMT